MAMMKVMVENGVQKAEWGCSLRRLVQDRHNNPFYGNKSATVEPLLLGHFRSDRCRKDLEST